MPDKTIAQLDAYSSPQTSDVVPIVDTSLNLTKKITLGSLTTFFGNATAVSLRTDGVANSTQTILNLIAGSNITLTPNASGGVTIAASGGGSPGGSNTQVQFNDSGAFAGDSGLTYNKIDQALSLYTLLGIAGLGISTTVGGISILTETIDGSGNGYGITLEAAGGGSAANDEGGNISIIPGRSNGSELIHGNLFLGRGTPLEAAAKGGFVYIQTIANTPVNSPTDQPGSGGLLPMTYDITNNKLYIYNSNGGAWKSVTLS